MSDCALCSDRLETPTLRESAHWRMALNRNQNLLGKLIVVLRRHLEDVAELSSGEWADLQPELGWATTRLRAAFDPDHFNYAFLQNQDRHVHLHVVPRYASPRRLAGLEFTDTAFPSHYALSEDRRVGTDVLAELARVLSA